MRSGFCRRFITGLLTHHEFCCVNLIGRKLENLRKTNQMTPTYLNVVSHIPSGILDTQTSAKMPNLTPTPMNTNMFE